MHQISMGDCFLFCAMSLPQYEHVIKILCAVPPPPCHLFLGVVLPQIIYDRCPPLSFNVVPSSRKYVRCLPTPSMPLPHSALSWILQLSRQSHRLFFIVHFAFCWTQLNYQSSSTCISKCGTLSWACSFDFYYDFQKETRSTQNNCVSIVITCKSIIGIVFFNISISI